MERDRYYEGELEEKNREIAGLETDLRECQREIRRLRTVCREYEADRGKFPIQELLQIFEENGWKGSYSIGRWSIANGGYDLWFQIYEDGIAKIECVDGEVSVCTKADVDAEPMLARVLQTLEHLYTAG